MGFRKTPFDKRGKTIPKGKSKAHVTIESNVVYHQNIISSPFNFKYTLLIKRSTSMQQEVFAMGTSTKGTKLHFLHMFP